MDFAYSIDEYIPASNILYVMYTPRPSTGLVPRAVGVPIDEALIINEDHAGVHQAVINQAPIDSWIQEAALTEDDHSDFLQDLVGLHEVESTPVAHPDTNWEIEKPDPAAPIENNPDVKNNYYGNVPLSLVELDGIVTSKHHQVRMAGWALILKYVNEHKVVFLDPAPPAPYDEQKVWIKEVHDEVTAKVAAIVVSTDPVDLVFVAESNLPPSLVL